MTAGSPFGPGIPWGHDPCANCDHARNRHEHRRLPWWSREPRHLACLVDGCLCGLFVDEPSPEQAEQAA